MARVTGIGGVFLRSKDPKRLTAWYVEHLGIVPSAHGITFEWSDEVPKGTGATAWNVFEATSDYFSATDGSEASAPPRAVMINYRVDDLDGLLEKLKAAGVWIDPKRDDYDFGRFAWINDCDGNRLELWQPIAN